LAGKTGKTRQNAAFFHPFILKDLAEQRLKRPKNEKGGRRTAALRKRKFLQEQV
jgi:hypothetical protein